MKTTTNHGLKKPEGTDIVNIDDLNYNADKLDGLLVPATTTTNGLMSKDDKTKLNGVAAGANNYTHPATHPASMISGLHAVATSGSYADLLNKPSTFPPSSHTHTKSQITDFPTALPANGGNADTVDGKHFSEFVQMPPSRMSVDDFKNANYPYAYRSSISDGTQIGLPVASWYHIDYFRHLDNNGFGHQIAYPLNHTGAIYYRGSSGTTWNAWKKINDGGNADTVDGKHASDFLANTGGTVSGNITFSGIRGLKWDCGRSNQSEIFWNASSIVDYGVTHRVDGVDTMVLNPYIVHVNGEIRATAANNFRIVQGNYGFFIRNDGGNTWFMLTASGDPYGGYGDLRPLRIENATGDLYSNHALTIGSSNGNVKKTTTSAASPSSGANGDVWIMYS